jgi:7-cyano-7-deazaguanine synthase
MRAVVLVSGGMDSLVTAATAAAGGRECAFLHVTYGQRTAARERRAFEGIADHYGPYRRMVADIAYLTEIGGSALTDKRIPVPTKATEGVPVTYVPFRNAHLITIATSLAEVEGAGEIYIGATQMDYSGYPDCRREFYDAFEKAIEIGTKPETHIRIITPVINMTKERIVREGLRLGAPFELSWSCYTNSDIACGVCESCVLRRKGFEAAGAKDPIAYA